MKAAASLSSGTKNPSIAENCRAAIAYFRQVGNYQNAVQNIEWCKERMYHYAEGDRGKCHP